MKKKLLSIVLLFVFAISGFNGTAYAEDNNDFGIFYADEVKEGFERSIDRMDSHMLEMLQSSIITYNKAIKQIGFDDLGGAYYDDDGKLHILVTKSASLKRDNTSVATLNLIMNETNVEDSVFIDYSKYSYNELMDFKSKINKYFSTGDIIAAGIDDQLNKVIVYVNEGASSLSIISESVPNDAIKIVASKIEIENTASYKAYCGSGLYNSGKNKSASLACGVVWDRSTSNPQYGYLTAGHFALKDDIISFYLSNGGWIELGTVVKSKNSGKVDAALISRGNSDISSTSTAIDGSSYLFCGGVPAQNQPIVAHGYTSGTVTGVVKNTSFDFDGFTDLVWTSALMDGGDSGGAVIAPITTPELSITGVIKGKITLLNVNSGMVYTKFNNIMDEWDLNGTK